MVKQEHFEIISKELSIPSWQVKNTLQLFEEGASLPFIARYRKEKTGSLDEVSLAEIQLKSKKLKELDARKEYILQTIEEQGKLNQELRNAILQSSNINELEDIYLPYKVKRKTRATIAIEKGLEPLADIIFKQQEKDLHVIAQKFIHKDVEKVEDALAGARDILAERLNEDILCRNKVRQVFRKTAVLHSSIKKGIQVENAIKYKDYLDYREKLNEIPSHRYLALRRGETEGFLKLRTDIDEDYAYDLVERQLVRGMPSCKEQMRLAIKDGLKRLTFPSIETEFLHELKEKSDHTAIELFAQNLKQLLMTAPLGKQRICAIDPGIRTGCKTVVLNENGDLLHDTVIYPMQNPKESEEKLKRIVEKYNIQAIAIGNGTAGRETETFIRKLNLKDINLFLVSEQGASIYSASDIAREEMPDKDVTVRGAVSIGRRLMDPLAELVKIDPKSIGVGQYQHDVNQSLLKESLDTVVSSCVNQVGVELNTASSSLLSYVSGVGPSIAKNILAYRKENGGFKSKKELLKVPRLGEKVFEQAAGFLRIRNGQNPLDNTAVHPERYALVEKMAKDAGLNISDLVKSSFSKKQIEIKKYVSSDVGLPTLEDILSELEKPGRDPREKLETFQFANVHTMEDLKKGMVLPGIVTNITAFGCFVDIGVHQDGLVHISHLTNKFVKDPNDVVKLQDKVKVKILDVDAPRKRISLSMKEV